MQRRCRYGAALGLCLGVAAGGCRASNTSPEPSMTLEQTMWISLVHAGADGQGWRYRESFQSQADAISAAYAQCPICAVRGGGQNAQPRVGYWVQVARERLPSGLYAYRMPFAQSRAVVEFAASWSTCEVLVPAKRVGD